MSKNLIIRPKKQEPLFPLYDRMYEQVVNKKSEEDPDIKIWPQVSKLEIKNARIIFFIIVRYARLHGNKEEIPYVKKIPDGRKGPIYDVENLPLELKLIIAECISEITGD